MKKYLFCIISTAILWASSLLWSSCSSDDGFGMSEEELIEYLKSDKCPQRVQALKDCPKWLYEKISQMEDAVPWRLFTHVIKFTYRGNTYYLIYTMFSCSVFDDIYNAHGTKVTFSEADWFEKVNDWVCIYVQE